MKSSFSACESGSADIYQKVSQNDSATGRLGSIVDAGQVDGSASMVGLYGSSKVEGHQDIMPAVPVSSAGRFSQAKMTVCYPAYEAS